MRTASVRELARRLGLGSPQDPWPDYLARFHAERPGVIQDALRRSTAGERNPYSWLARAVSRTAEVVVDVRCGAGVLSRRLADGPRQVIGVEDSAEELEQAMSGGAGADAVHWVRGAFDHLPLSDSSVDAVVTSMGMVTVPDPRLLVDEASRVLRPGGIFACMAPTIRPVPPSLMRPAVELAARVGSTPSFPGALELRMTDLLAQRGLRKVEDARSCYVFTVRDSTDADLLMSAMYLPGSTASRRQSARDWLVHQVQSRGPVNLPVPMRRVVALKDPQPADGVA